MRDVSLTRRLNQAFGLLNNTRTIPFRKGRVKLFCSLLCRYKKLNPSPDVAAIFSVLVAVHLHQILLLEPHLNSDQDDSNQKSNKRNQTADDYRGARSRVKGQPVDHS